MFKFFSRKRKVQALKKELDRALLMNLQARHFLHLGMLAELPEEQIEQWADRAIATEIEAYCIHQEIMAKGDARDRKYAEHVTQAILKL